MKILIIAQYLRDVEDFENNNSRFVYLASLLSDHSQNEIEIITSDFNHAKKRHFKKTGNIPRVKITTIHEKGYSRNISFRRIISHKELAVNISKYLYERERPDLCYCAVPSLDVAYAVAKFCQDNSVTFAVDIQDLWPEAFKMVVGIPVLNELLFSPMRRKANRIYSMADMIIAVSQTYANRAMLVNKKCNKPIVAFLGTDRKVCDRYTSEHCFDHIKQCKDFMIAYVGSMSASYDLTVVIDAISRIQFNLSVKLVAMGDGPKKDFFLTYAAQRGVNAEFTGRLPYSQMIERLGKCDIAVNPIRKGSAASIINKVGDYAMAGLPVVNTQESIEYRGLLEEYQAGINCECGNVVEMSDAFVRLITNSELRCNMSNNSRRLGLELFDREKTYSSIVDGIMSHSL